MEDLWFVYFDSYYYCFDSSPPFYFVLSSAGDTMLMIQGPACFVLHLSPFSEFATTKHILRPASVRFLSPCCLWIRFLPSKFLSYSFSKRFFLSCCLLSPPPFLRPPSQTKKYQNTHTHIHSISISKYTHTYNRITANDVPLDRLVIWFSRHRWGW